MDNELVKQAIKDNLPAEDNSNVESDADLWANDKESLAQNYK